MNRLATRRSFLATTALVGTGLVLGDRLHAAGGKSQFKKALIGKPTAKNLEAWKVAGFDGMESNVWDIEPDKAAEARRLAERAGMRIHSVMRGWANFNSPDKQRVAADLASVKTALRAAQAFGADTVLLVPCRLLTRVAVPKPERFDIEFDPKTCHVTRVVKGDNAEFAEYIKLQNQATDLSRRAVEQLIPVAEKAGVVIALENVWNNFWVQPALAAQFIKSFDTRWVRSYYDIGNHVKYAAPQAWIRALGKSIVKLHVKDFKIDRDAARGGKFVDIREGDVNWPAVTQALHAIGYQGWMTIEGSGGLSVAEKSRRLDLIIAGK